MDRRGLGRVEAHRRACRRRGVGDRRGQTVAHREPRPSFVVVDVPHAGILPQATPRPSADVTGHGAG